LAAGRKNLPARASIAEFASLEAVQQSPVLLVFRRGMALAEECASYGPLSERRSWSSTMFLALGAASSAFDALKALTSSKSSAQSTGVSQNSTSPFDLLSPSSTASAGSSTGFGGSGSQISPATMSALLDAQSQSSTGSTASASKSRSSALKDLFAQIDGDGDGKITKSEFEDALGAGGTNLAQADDVFGKLDKDGDGSVSLAELASALKGGKGHRHHDRESVGSNSDPLLQALQGTAGSSTAATSSYNFIEQMIQRQAQAISSSATASLSVSA
jgi:hypothetical protein